MDPDFVCACCPPLDDCQYGNITGRGIGTAVPCAMPGRFAREEGGKRWREGCINSRSAFLLCSNVNPCCAYPSYTSCAVRACISCISTYYSRDVETFYFFIFFPSHREDPAQRHPLWSFVPSFVFLPSGRSGLLVFDFLFFSLPPCLRSTGLSLPLNRSGCALLLIPNCADGGSGPP